MIYWRDALEMGNGVWALLALWLFVFMAFHLWVVGKMHWVEIKNRQFPLSVQLAIGVIVIAGAILHTRGTIWYLRYTHGGILTMQDFETVWFLLGVFGGCVGFLCILRAVTKPMLGHWPWLSALASVTAYLLWWGGQLK